MSLFLVSWALRSFQTFMRLFSEFTGQVNYFIRSNIPMVDHGDAEDVRKKVFVPGYADVCLLGTYGEDPYGQCNYGTASWGLCQHETCALQESQSHEWWKCRFCQEAAENPAHAIFIYNHPELMQFNCTFTAFRGMQAGAFSCFSSAWQPSACPSAVNPGIRRPPAAPVSIPCIPCTSHVPATHLLRVEGLQCCFQHSSQAMVTRHTVSKCQQAIQELQSQQQQLHHAYFECRATDLLNDLASDLGSSAVSGVSVVSRMSSILTDQADRQDSGSESDASLSDLKDEFYAARDQQIHNLIVDIECNRIIGQ
ncbi:hypothetical protein DFH08DRAFT_823535 [Mycena albidolilacea]|uniref:Uncharacterized protein n=1 Tax=Mycena albidolilacea TaxID=1033008 RepID=A0AAD6Z607_9AGAR|nr:hypothetical protein DFH08DRAFT_823535 [Mycena albidolilacea]